MCTHTHLTTLLAHAAHDWKFDDQTTNSFINTKWSPGEPNGWRNRGEPCAAIYGEVGAIIDLSCNK